MAEKKKGLLASLPGKLKARTAKRRAEIRKKKEGQTKAGMKARTPKPTPGKPYKGPGDGSILRQRTPAREGATEPKTAKGTRAVGPKTESQAKTSAKIKKQKAAIAQRNKLNKAFGEGAKKASSDLASKNLKKQKETQKNLTTKAKGPEKTASYSDLAKKAKEKKVYGKKKAASKKLMSRADKAAKSGNIKKAARLEKRSARKLGQGRRKVERIQGKRKSVVGTALKGAGLGLARGLARAGGYGGKFKKGMASQKKGYVKPNPSELKPIGSSLRAQNKAVDKDKENK